MSQFLVYKNPNPASKNQYPYLLDIQSDLLSELKTTVVLPLTPALLATDFTISRLNMVVEINGDKFILLTQDIAGVNRGDLKVKVCDLSHLRSEIIAAVDFMICGI